MFEPFFTGKQEGSGLGLTTVQNIIHGHKGKIEVESEVGKGTEFILLLPK
jgi:signal transduction histidine kinase